VVWLHILERHSTFELQAAPIAPLQNPDELVGHVAFGNWEHVFGTIPVHVPLE
jgi:hypothetical protein